MSEDLDELDRNIVHALQEDARHTSATEIAERLEVSARTVRNHIHQLEERGIIEGYWPEVNYEGAGYQLHTLIICTAPIPDREALAEAALDVSGVVSVREIMTGEENLHVEVVGSDGDDLNRIGQELNALGLSINDEDIIRSERYGPFAYFDKVAREDPEE